MISAENIPLIQADVYLDLKADLQLTFIWGSLTLKFNIFIIQCREKWTKQNMKKTFRENVFICEDFSVNRKENELRRKYGILGGSTEKNKDTTLF